MPRQHSMAVHEIARQGFLVHVPYGILEKKKPPEILFPGFGFVQFDRRRDRWRPITNTPGVRRLISSSPETPTPIRRGVIEAFILSGVMNKFQPVGLLDAIKPGTSVRVLSENFGDLVGIVRESRETRLRVMMGLLEIDVARSMVERV